MDNYEKILFDKVGKSLNIDTTDPNKILKYLLIRENVASRSIYFQKRLCSNMKRYNNKLDVTLGNMGNLIYNLKQNRTNKIVEDTIKHLIDILACLNLMGSDIYDNIFNYLIDDLNINDISELEKQLQPFRL